MGLLDQWNKNKFSIYKNEEKTVLKLLEVISKWLDEVITTLDKKTDLYGDHKGSWQGLNKPTLSEEGMRATVEQIKDVDLPSINEKISSTNEKLSTKADKLNITEMVNVVELGFDNTGENDITQALQNIFDNENNKTLYFPSGNYKISGNLIVGDNKNFKLIGENYRTVKFNCSSAVGKVFYISASTLEKEIHVTFENISFINTGKSQELTCLYYYLCSGDVIAKSCFFNKFYNNIELNKTFTFKLDKCISINAYNSCLSIRACNQFLIIDGQYTGAKKNNIDIYYSMCFNINCDYSAYGDKTQNGILCTASLGGKISGYYEGTPLNAGIYLDGSQAIKISDLNISYFSEGVTVIKINDSKSTRIENVAFNHFNEPIVNALAIHCSNNAFETIISNCYFNYIGKCIKLDNNTRTKIEYCSALPSRINTFIESTDTDGCVIDVNCISSLLDKSTLPRLGVVKYNINTEKNFGDTLSRPTGKYRGQQFFDLERKKLMIYDGTKWWYTDGTEVN